MKPPSERLTYLDVIRAVAALSVVVSNYIERTPLHHWFIFEFLRPAQSGVVVFFMLSGFVLPFSHEGSYQHENFLDFRFFPPVSDLLVINHSCLFRDGTLPWRGLERKTIVANAIMFRALTS